MKKYDNYTANLDVLARAGREDLDNEFIMSGIIDKFSLQFELGWKVLKELLQYEGIAAGNSGSPREILKAAYGLYDFMDEDIWLEMLRERNNMTHIYDAGAARELVREILTRYIPEFVRLREAVGKRYADILSTL